MLSAINADMAILLRLKKLLFLVALMSLSLPAGTGAASDPHRLEIVTRDGKVHRFQVELARTPEEQARGLMFREKLNTDSGMLFLYDVPVLASFWMKNTLIPLDMIFIGADGRIVNIHANARPHDLTPKVAEKPVSAVLEIGGGLAERLGIGAGDRVRHPHFDD